MKHSALTYSLLFLLALMAIVGGIGLFDSAVYVLLAMAIVPVLIGLNVVAVLRAEKDASGNELSAQDDNGQWYEHY